MKKLSKVLLSDQFQIAAAIVIATAIGIFFAESISASVFISVIFAIFGVISLNPTDVDVDTSASLKFQGYLMILMAILLATSIQGLIANIALMAFLYRKLN